VRGLPLHGMHAHAACTAMQHAHPSLSKPCPLPPPQNSKRPGPKGVALGYDELMQSMVYDPADVPIRHTKRDIAEQLEALYLQYDNEDFDLGIKQYMIEQAIQADLEDGLDKKGGAQDFEEKLAEALFADEGGQEKDTLKTEDVWPDAFTTEVCGKRGGGGRRKGEGGGRGGGLLVHDAHPSYLTPFHISHDAAHSYTRFVHLAPHPCRWRRRL
jgi:hypothetical protein